VTLALASAKRRKDVSAEVEIRLLSGGSFA